MPDKYCDLRRNAASWKKMSVFMMENKKHPLISGLPEKQNQRKRGHCWEICAFVYRHPFFPNIKPTFYNPNRPRQDLNRTRSSFHASICSVIESLKSDFLFWSIYVALRQPLWLRAANPAGMLDLRWCQMFSITNAKHRQEETKTLKGWVQDFSSLS